MPVNHASQQNESQPHDSQQHASQHHASQPCQSTMPVNNMTVHNMAVNNMAVNNMAVNNMAVNTMPVNMPGNSMTVNFQKFNTIVRVVLLHSNLHPVRAPPFIVTLPWPMGTVQKFQCTLYDLLHNIYWPKQIYRTDDNLNSRHNTNQRRGRAEHRRTRTERQKWIPCSTFLDSRCLII